MSARDDYSKLDSNTRGPSHQGETSRQAQAALDEIDQLRAENSRLRCIADAAFTMVRDDGDDDGFAVWVELVGALEDANYEPRAGFNVPATWSSTAATMDQTVVDE